MSISELEEAEKNINQLSTDVGALKSTLETIDTHLKTCKAAAEECDKKNGNANYCSNNGLEPAKFTTTFTPESVSIQAWDVCCNC